MSLTKLIAGTAAAMLVITPVAASAETRAASSMPAATKKVAAPKAKAGFVRVKPTDSTAMGQSSDKTGSILLGVGAGAAVITAIVLATDS